MKTVKKNTARAAAIALAAGLVMISGQVLAGTGGAELDDVWLTISDWTQGTLGRIIAGLMVVTGIVAGIRTQSLFAFVSGAGAGIGLYNAPTILETMVSATLPLIN